MQQWLAASLLILALRLSTIAANQHEFTAQEIQEDIFESICSFASCRSEEYYSVFRERDGSPANATTRLIPNIRLGESHVIDCDTHCPLDNNTNVLWCIHLLTIKYEVRLCLNETGQYVSSAASLIQVNNQLYNHLENHFTAFNATLEIDEAPVLLRYAYAGCMVQSGQCESVTYYSLNIINTLRAISISEFPTTSGNLTLFLGDSVNLTCFGVTARRLTQLFWFYESGAAVCPVRENPFCVPYNTTSCQTSRLVQRNCPIDVRGGRRCKLLRVHSYNYNTVENCTYDLLRSTAMMRIDNVTWSVGGVYTCRPTTGNVVRTMNITIERRPVFITFPATFNQVVEEGSSSIYNCTVASNTMVQWLFKGVAVTECKDSKFSCLHEDQKLVCTTSTTEEGPFLIHSISLHICGAYEGNSGQYSCKVQGFSEKIVQQNNLIVQQTVQVIVNQNDEHNNDKRSSEDDKSDGVNWIIILLVSISAVLICVLAALLISAVVKVLLYTRSHRNCGMMNGSYEISLTSPISSEDDGRAYPMLQDAVKCFHPHPESVSDKPEGEPQGTSSLL